jgi:hypothetical protein|tara:strand:- start:125 stop:1174 length:1050 start_codon:yes stop_codon:yes gene_type:complete
VAYTTINNPELHFQPKIYSGNGSTQSITFDGSENMQPDWVWIRCRSDAESSSLCDSIRGANKHLRSDDTTAETTSGTVQLSSFDSNGFSLGSGDGQTNGSGRTYASWSWKAGTAFSNSAGANGASLASSGSKNDTAGFSIVSYTGDESGNDTIFHGLSQTPDLIFTKARQVADSWGVFHNAYSLQQYTFLNTNSTVASASSMFNALPGSTVFTVGDNAAVNDDGTMIAYCFHNVKGYQKIGKYVGNGSSNGPVIYTGFRPSYVFYKNITTADNYFQHDKLRQGFNSENELLFADITQAESTVNRIDILSNGFKAIDSDKGVNKSGDTYIYWAIAESPFVNSNGVPTNAR